MEHVQDPPTLSQYPRFEHAAFSFVPGTALVTVKLAVARGSNDEMGTKLDKGPNCSRNSIVHVAPAGKQACVVSDMSTLTLVMPTAGTAEMVPMVERASSAAST